MQSRIARFIKDESAATAIEYGLIAALIAVALIGGFTAFGSSMVSMFGHIEDTAGTALANAG